MNEREKIEELLTRSVAAIYPNKEELKKVLLSGKKLRIYNGIDPTATYVHLGHATNYLILKKFHELGHKIIILIGDFTAMIGDPSDKNAARKRLTKEEVLLNLKSFKNQIGKIIDFENKTNLIEFRFNADWLAKLTWEEGIELASHFTVQQIIERDIFQKRIKENKPLYLHEFFYPLMQGYDSVALEADLEIGGTDQTFNMLAGRILVKDYQNREKFVITTTLLEHPITKEKLMSKSLGTGIGLDENPTDMFGKVMAMADETIIQLYTDCTNISFKEVKNIQQELEKGSNPKDIKTRLAEEIVAMYHGKEKARQARENFEKTFSKGEFPENARVVETEKGVKLGDILVENKIVSSKTEFRRLVESGAISSASGKKIENPNILAEELQEEGRKLRIGKKSFVIINLH
ncbi:MAG: tyrosine--tRNA ligase [Patescibacteria group bacterium]